MQISVIDREAYVIPEGQRVQPGSRKMRNHERYRQFELHTGKLVTELTVQALHTGWFTAQFSILVCFSFC